jgi:hypothetical protein
MRSGGSDDPHVVNAVRELLANLRQGFLKPPPKMTDEETVAWNREQLSALRKELEDAERADDKPQPYEVIFGHWFPHVNK